MLDDPIDQATDALTTPFEVWCEVLGLHPEQPGAWEHFSGHAASAYDESVHHIG